jgi:hypothetical protein
LCLVLSRLISSYSRPITTVVGAPIPVTQVDEPSWDAICELHTRYVAAVQALFDAHVHKYGNGEECSPIVFKK